MAHPFDPALKIAFIRTSDRIGFKRCRRKWNWQSGLKHNLEHEEKAEPLWTGSGMHFALEDFHGYNLYGDPGTAFWAYAEAQRRCPSATLPDGWVEQLHLGEGMMNYYVQWLKNRNPLKTFWLDGVPQVEVLCYIDLGLDGLYGYDKVYYQLTLDRVAIDDYKRLWIVEYKSAIQFATGHFMTDPQVTAYCTPVDTEILTRQGWKTHDKLVLGEEVLGYNLETGKMQWTNLLGVSTFEKEETIKVSNKSFSFVTTPNHRWVKTIRHKGETYKNKPKRTIKLDPIQTYKDNSYITLSACLESSTSNVTEDEAAILGLLLTEGSWGYYDHFGLRAEICQKKHINEVQALLDKIPCYYARTSDLEGTKCWHLSTEFFKDLMQKAGLDPTDINLRGWEKFVLGMDAKARKAFCDAAMLGGGSIGTNGQKSFHQNPGVKQELFRLAFFLTGVFPSKPQTEGKGNPWSIPSGNVFNLTTAFKRVKPFKIEPNKTRDVWCPQTGLGTWIMRQGSQIAITGNTWGGQMWYGREIAGTCYQQHKKSIPDYPKVLSNGHISINKQQATSYTLYYDSLKNLYGKVERAPRENIDFLNRLTELETEDQDPFVRRDWLDRNEYQLQAEQDQIYQEVIDMLNPDLPLYPNKTRDCGWDCRFLTACINMDDGSDHQFEVDSTTRQRSDGDTSWRLYLPPKEELLRLPHP